MQDPVLQPARMEHAIPAAGIDSDEDAIVTEGTATAAEQPDSVATTSHAQPAAAEPPAQPQQQGGSGAVWALAAGAVGLGVACLVRWRGNRGKSRRVTVRRDQVYLSLVNQQQPSVALPSTASTCLAGKAFAISDRFDVQGMSTRAGSEQLQAERQPCHVSAPTVDLLLLLGASPTATVPSQPLALGLSPLASSCPRLPNPSACERMLGGGEYGAAVAAAASLVELSLAVDELGSALVPAACCGAFAFRPTAGVLPLEGAGAAAPTLATPCLLAASPQALLQAGRGLRVPGSTGTADGLANYLIAEDLFGVCGEEVQRAVPAVVAAVRRWAGADQAQGLSLCEWLFHRIPSLKGFMPGPTTGGTPPGSHTEAVLEALAAAAQAVRRWEWKHSPYGAWAAAHPALLAKDVAAAVKAAAGGTSEERYRAGIAVADELSTGMRAALQEGYVFVLPTTPGPPPLQGGAVAAAAAAAYTRRCVQFAALASLAGVPQVALPMPTPSGPPLSVSLVTLQRRDFTLLQAAVKLGPFLEEEAAALEKSRTEKTLAVVAAPAGAAADNQGPSEQDLAAANAAKEAGNAAFKAQRYGEAVRRYSEAISLDPGNNVYYSNRAMAYLKLGQYSAAEADCDAALQLDPHAVKALLRRGSARLARGDLSSAAEDFARVLELEPRNRQATEELRGLRAVLGDGGDTGMQLNGIAA